MSIQLTQLLELSHELCHARKRRCEWETHAESVLRRRRDAFLGTQENTPPPPGPAASLRKAGDSGMVESADIAEMQVLCESLRAQGLSPRAPDVEQAYARLLSAAARPGRSDDACIEGSDFEWMTAGNEDAVASGADCAVSGPGLSCAPNGDRQSRASEGGSENATGGSPTAPLLHCESDGARECRLAGALHRLSSLLRSTVSPNEESEDEDEEDEEAATLALVEQMSREAMIEAERYELSQLLVSSALDVAAASTPVGA